MTVHDAMIMRGSRALLTALQPFTGERAIGTVSVRALAGRQFKLDRYTYLMPIQDGAKVTNWLFKVDEGPEDDKGWLVTDAGIEVDVYSAVGGQRFNMAEGTEFAFDYPDPDLDPAFPVVAVADFTGATESNDFASFQDVGVYETFDGPSIPLDMRRSLLQRFPAALVSFVDLMPADGVTVAQTRQGSVNAGTGTKFYKINYAINVIVSITDHDQTRRYQGMVLTEKVLGELIDAHAVNDGEPLSNPSGIQVRQVFRENGPQEVYKKFFIFTILVSTMVGLTREERRTFLPWKRARFSIDHPQLPVDLPNQGTIRVVNEVEVDMLQSPDLTMDGIFSRSDPASYWRATPEETGAGELDLYSAGQRRSVDGRLLLEPLVSGIGIPAYDLTAWDSELGAGVDGGMESNPAGSPNSADVVTLAGSVDIDSGINEGTYPVTVGVPVTLTMFVKIADGENPFPGSFRLTVDDGVTEHHMGPLDALAEWHRIRFEFIPSGTSARIYIRSAVTTDVRLAIWGVFIKREQAWGPEFPPADVKVKDELVFLPALPKGANATPQKVLTGKWRLNFRTLPYVPVDMTGAGQTPAGVLCAITDGSTNLLMVTLAGNANSGTANLALHVRNKSPFTLSGLAWTPGDELSFEIDAAGELTVIGTQLHDNTYPIPRYDDEVLPADRLVFGTDASGTRAAVAGFYSVEIVE